jgi:hypothetical protein
MNDLYGSQLVAQASVPAKSDPAGTEACATFLTAIVVQGSLA